MSHPLTPDLHAAGIRLRQPISRARVAAFESQAGITLPEDYVAFITEAGNGGLGPCRLMPLDEWDAAYWIDSPRPQMLAAPCIITPDALGHEDAWLDRSGVQDWETRFNAGEWDPMTGTLAVAEIGCGLFYSLVVNGPHRGRVFTWGDFLRSPPMFVPEPSFGGWIAARIQASARGEPVHFLDGRLLHQTGAESPVSSSWPRLKRLKRILGF